MKSAPSTPYAMIRPIGWSRNSRPMGGIVSHTMNAR